MNGGRPGARKRIGTREWYDFVAMVTDVAPCIHPGGEEATRTLLRMPSLGAPRHVLDVGYGPGTTATLIAQETGARVTGIDFSEGMIAKARERVRREGLAETLHFQAGDVLNLDFSDSTFDAVLFESVLTVMPGDPAAALAEMVRVLRPGGHVGGNEGTIDPSALPELDALLAQHPAIQRTFTPITLRKQFEEAGLDEIEMDVVALGGAPSLGSTSIVRTLGLGRLLPFLFRAYPKLVEKLLSDARLREAHRIDEQVTKLSKAYMGYVLIAGRKLG